MWSLTFRSPEFLIWKCQAFLEQKLLAVSNSSVPCVCNKLDSGNMKSFYLPNKHTPFFIGSMNQLKIKVLWFTGNIFIGFLQHICFQEYWILPFVYQGTLKFVRGNTVVQRGEFKECGVFSVVSTPRTTVIFVMCRSWGSKHPNLLRTLKHNKGVSYSKWQCYSHLRNSSPNFTVGLKIGRKMYL